MKKSILFASLIVLTSIASFAARYEDLGTYCYSSDRNSEQMWNQRTGKTQDLGKAPKISVWIYCESYIKEYSYSGGSANVHGAEVEYWITDDQVNAGNLQGTNVTGTTQHYKQTWSTGNSWKLKVNAVQLTPQADIYSRGSAKITYNLTSMLGAGAIGESETGIRLETSAYDYIWNY